ncbi:MAG: hypothetical protein S4CHLAM45_12450 [Chlamydiales bacterium]|nr:hypothetical protein [Chlamydiales bacterium]MCH9619734.1 hypothetical protein [Chlamydiales bacterium]MCH9623340.1 hypothetical protein [Chlamydiales bacterium]
MEIRKGLLFIVIFVALSCHLAFVVYLHKHPISTHFLYDRPLTYIEDEAFELLKRKERSEILAQIFDQITETTVEVKEDLHDLQAEFSPTASIAFPDGEPFLIADEAFRLEHDPLDFSSIGEGELTPFVGETFITSSPLLVSSEIPILNDFIQNHDAYDELGIVAGSNHFDVHIEYVQKQNRPGYVFKATFSPKREVRFKRIQQNYYFLLDRSNSIPRARFALNKAVVSKALDYLKPRDTFNILIFDDKVLKLSESSLKWNEENVIRARGFLEKHGHGGYFASTELYSSLGKIIPENVSDREVNTAILLSDGDTYLPQEKQRKVIGGWTDTNEGKVALYSIASGGGNNLPLLDLITSFNKGALIYSYDHGQLSDRLVQLIHMIRNPIGKEMVATAVPVDKQSVILLQPKNRRLPDLYQNRPFVVYGSTNRLCDFVLFLQGKYYDQRFDIKKRITFENAKLGSSAIEKAWTQLVVQEFYERFFEDGNKKHLDAAKHLLAPLNIPVPLLNK